MKLAILTLVAVTALSGCGGDTQSVEPRIAATATALASHRPRALAAAPAAAADQLMNFAEAAYSLYFPSRQPTQSQPPFLYRYYPQTGIYLGLVVSADPVYHLNGVYVMGGGFGGQPTYVGPLSAFITVTDPGSTGVDNGCFDLSWFDSQGTHTVVGYRVTGSISTSGIEDTVYGVETTFEGNRARQVIRTTTGLLPAFGTTGTDTTTGYLRRTGDAELTEYGAVSVTRVTVSGRVVTVTARSVASPPTIIKEFGLAMGQSYALVESLTTTQTTVGLPGTSEAPEIYSDTSTTETTFVGRETISVPAGTFDTCKFRHTFDGDQTSTETLWVIFGKGIIVKLQTPWNEGTAIQEATSVTLNGNRLGG